ncbi:MAG: hypothetical protein PF904_03625 [Kiritimatiellae bacterium]|jgi:hypothetical protein|nr:hypothetical protein [Kiritimatiellia bacterium]
MTRNLLLLCLFFGVGISSAVENSEDFQSFSLKAIDCSIQVPTSWKVYDQSNQSISSWVVTPDDLNKAHYDTGVRVDSLSQVKNKTGSIASKWVADRIKDKSSSLQVLSSESGPTDDYFNVKRLVTEEVYSPGRDIYRTYRMCYSWFWNDKYDFVVCMVMRVPEKSWKSLSPSLEKVEKLDFDESAWKKKLENAQKK